MTHATLLSTPNLSRLQRRRLSWRVAQGAPLQKAAERAGLKGDDAEALLACPDFGQMVEDYRALVRLPTEERMGRLVEAALMVLEEAMRRHDPRAAFFILKQQLLGRCPAKDLARGVMRALERPPPKPREPDDPSAPPRDITERHPVPAIDRAAYGAAAVLREGILDEAEALADLPGESAEAEERPENVIWSRDELARIEDLGTLLHHDLSERQLILIAEVQMERERLARTCPTGEPSPETDPKNPNAPNN